MQQAFLDHRDTLGAEGDRLLSTPQHMQYAVLLEKDHILYVHTVYWPMRRHKSRIKTDGYLTQ